MRKIILVLYAVVLALVAADAVSSYATPASDVDLLCILAFKVSTIAIAKVSLDVIRREYEGSEEWMLQAMCITFITPCAFVTAGDALAYLAVH